MYRYIVDNSPKVVFADCRDPSHRVLFYETNTHEEIRGKFIWEQHQDKNGKPLEEVRYILLKDLDKKHLKRLCYFTLKGFPEVVNKWLLDEWNYRIDNGL
ncbi:hypothetical protein VPHG_00048 [Vibrio phage 11895-B1]|uniref:hypothetical protein n=1 Tax=Vibrio phage 11895-B1 TaxID=754075 RepID=UPI0002C0F80B|nr:hypothetical protein VPHG_00048 [Vibrio phage 11895-B1]AGH32115.1 hypothetical protein VPHG_00048 [Vibrio phage 11895-B1]